MKIDESHREELMKKMNAEGGNLWVELQSQVHHHGDELPIWVLIDDKNNIAKIYDLFLRISKPYRKTFAETKFTIAFNQIRNGKYLLWNLIEDEEIKSGILNSPLAEDPEEITLRDSSVFLAVQNLIRERNL